MIFLIFLITFIYYCKGRGYKTNSIRDGKENKEKARY